MAWLIIRVNSNPKNEVTWKAGDIIEVRSEEAVTQNGWGRLETLPALYRIQVTGVDAAAVKELLERVQYDGEVMTRVRRHKLLVANLPAAIRAQLDSTGMATISRNEALASIRDNDGGTVGLP